MCSVQCAVCSVQCAVCSVQCAVCSVQCSLLPGPLAGGAELSLSAFSLLPVSKTGPTAALQHYKSEQLSQHQAGFSKKDRANSGQKNLCNINLVHILFLKNNFTGLVTNLALSLISVLLYSK